MSPPEGPSNGVGLTSGARARAEASHRYIDSTGAVRTLTPIATSALSSTPIVPLKADGEIPTRVMLDDEGYITPVEDQGSRGTCQTFATVAAIESEYLRQYGQSLSLSEEYLINMFNEGTRRTGPAEQ